MIAYTITKNSLSLFLNGESITLPRSSTQAKMILEELKKEKPDEEAITAFTTLNRGLGQYSIEELHIKDDTVYRFGIALPNIMSKRVIDCYQTGVPYKFLVNMFDRLNLNPSQRAVQESYQFLEHGNMPITPEGFFLGYKAVNENYLDYFSRSFDNHPGKSHIMPRNAVCDNADMGCDKGFHVGSLEYARGFGYDGGHIIIVMVDPADIVSIPKDCNFKKLRTCAYTVICECKGPLVGGGVAEGSDPYSSAFEQKEDKVEDETDKIKIEFFSFVR